MRGILGLRSAVRVSMGFYSEVLLFFTDGERFVGFEYPEERVSMGFYSGVLLFFTDGKGSVRNPRVEDPEERREIRLLVRRVRVERKCMRENPGQGGEGGGRERVRSRRASPEPPALDPQIPQVRLYITRLIAEQIFQI